ncbi:hypothetical protein A3Q56_05641 [Intoshia linei]|uniref:Uncharacterized protein n=1 Tax=Intoshia linei TaxID=1819745 RepID=A0A177AX94_9BILA|nr:hypothetical protein A3Q56_05641 [Intoshia linei]
MCIFRFKSFHDLGLSTFCLCKSKRCNSVYTNIYANYDEGNWFKAVTEETINTLSLKLDTFLSYTIFCAYTNKRLHLSLDAMRTFHTFNDECLMATKISSFIFYVENVENCNIKITDYEISPVSGLKLYANRKRKILCIVDDKHLKIERNLKKQCLGLDYICALNYNRTVDNTCVSDDISNQINACFNGKMQKLDPAGYTPIFKQGYYDTYCWPKYFNSASNVSCHDIQKINDLFKVQNSNSCSL